MRNLLHMKISLLKPEHTEHLDTDRIMQEEFLQYRDVLMRDSGLIERGARVLVKLLHPLVEWYLTPLRRVARDPLRQSFRKNNFRPRFFIFAKPTGV